MDKETKSEDIRKMGKKIYELISKFFHTEIIHSVRRLLAADIKYLYVGPSGGIIITFVLCNYTNPRISVSPGNFFQGSGNLLDKF